jgi:hypothetical protein
MGIEITAHDIRSRQLSDIPLQITLTGDKADKVIFKGLPAGASVSVGNRGKDDTWEIDPNDLGKAKLAFATAPVGAFQVEVQATGGSGGSPSSASSSFNVSVRPTSSATLTWERIGMAVMLVAFNVAVFMCWRVLYLSAQDVLTRDWSVVWEREADIWLAPGPITFWYDAETKLLHHRGPIDSALKGQLLGLAYLAGAEEPGNAGNARNGPQGTSGEKAKPASSAGNDRRLASYTAAVDNLTFKSNGQNDRYFLYLLSLAGLSGVLGTQVRAFANFIYVSTTRNDLDVGVWWPWYALRPVLGFLLGLMVVLLVQAKLFVPATDSLPSGTAWWMALAMLVGFAADDFAQRLRLVGQALFGKEK